MWMLCRIYLVFRVMRAFSPFNEKYTSNFETAEGIGCKVTYGLVIKSLLYERPYTMLFLCFIISSFWLSFAVRLFERPYYDDPKLQNVNEDDSAYQDYSLFNNSWWLVVVTMTTVGFGDYFPKTHLGRFVIVIACFIGVFIVSLTISTLTSY